MALLLLLLLQPHPAPTGDAMEPISRVYVYCSSLR